MSLNKFHRQNFGKGLGKETSHEKGAGKVVGKGRRRERSGKGSGNERKGSGKGPGKVRERLWERFRERSGKGVRNIFFHKI